MKRIPFSQVLKNAEINIRKEYERLYSLFYLKNHNIEMYTTVNLHDYCGKNFETIPFRGTCISLKDFDDSYGYEFYEYVSDFDIDYLVTFCEYSYNLALYCQGLNSFGIGITNAVRFYVQQVQTVIEKIGYMQNVHDGITDFVPKDQAAISVAEVVDSSLSYRVIEYNHHSMKGDLERKKDILLALSDKLEPNREKLKQINATFQSDLFTLLNSINIRHNNCDKNSKYYKKAVTDMTEEQIEKWYDDIYQMCLLAFLELEHLDRKERIKELKQNL